MELVAEGKVKAMLDAARQLFLHQGYDLTSMDQVARAAGVSKATVYAHFISKEQLLSALVQSEMKFITPEPFVVSKSQPLDVEVALRCIARQFTSLFLDDRGLALHRLITAQASRFPEIGRAFYDGCPKRWHAEVAALLSEAISQRILTIPDVDLATIQFLSLVRGDLPLNWALSLAPPTKDQLDKLIEGGIMVFMAAYRFNPQTD